MPIPRFNAANLNRALAMGDIGDAFQRFVHELLLPEHPALHCFPGGGKDGGIDLIAGTEQCLAVECKVVGEDTYASIEQRWNTVAGHLAKHLADPAGPTTGQAQYEPWYDTARPITRYFFCVSAELANEHQRRDLSAAITATFQQLAARHPHLAHLANVIVTVLDWNDLCDRLRARPQLVFRWFPGTRPNGLVPLDALPDAGTFRAYLSDAKLPYYSLADHLAVSPAPPGVLVLNEEKLLAQLASPAVTGLVINGKGGIGKSRLTLELGRRALEMGWTVLRVQSRLKEGALDDLAARLPDNGTALLLVDYIETQSDYAELVETLNLLNDTSSARLRYIAACRTGYYHEAVATTARHLPVDLTPPPGDAALAWLASYRAATVAHILSEAGFTDTPQHLAVCHDLPILAVFLSYLHAPKREAGLTELLKVAEFGEWVRRRVQANFAREIARDLALLIPLFPLTTALADQLDRNRFWPVFERLATDGWIERTGLPRSLDGEKWVTLHDVLADQILVNYLRSIPNTTDAFVREVLDLAGSLGELGSAVITLQRIADLPQINTQLWQRLLEKANASFQTKLLLEADPDAGDDLRKIIPELLEGGGEGCLLRKTHTIDSFQQESPPCSSEVFDKLLAQDLDSVFSETNDPVKFAKTQRPEGKKSSLYSFFMAWITEHATAPETWKSYEAWLKVGGERAVVQAGLTDWVKQHPTAPEAGFVYKAWLDAGGAHAVVQAGVADWVKQHPTAPEAGFVYKAWLDAGGAHAVVQAGVADWVKQHPTAPEAGFLYKAWLDAGGEWALIREAVSQWWATHGTEEVATFVAGALAAVPDLEDALVCGILEWCRRFPHHRYAPLHLLRLAARLAELELAEETYAAMQAVLAPVFTGATPLRPYQHTQMGSLLANLSEASRRHSRALRDRVDTLLVAWLRHSAALGQPPLPRELQRPAFARHLLLLLHTGELDIVRDRAALRSVLGWMATWDDENQHRLRPALESMARRYPDPELWRIVRLETARDEAG